LADNERRENRYKRGGVKMPMYHCKLYPEESVQCKDKREAIKIMECEECIASDCTGPIHITKYKEDIKHG